MGGCELEMVYRLDYYQSRDRQEQLMQVSVTQAKGQLTDLVRRAEAGDEIILTRHGHAAVRLVPINRAPDSKARKILLEAARAAGSAKATAGASAARSQDYLYSDDGLPG